MAMLDRFKRKKKTSTAIDELVTGPPAVPDPAMATASTTGLPTPPPDPLAAQATATTATEDLVGVDPNAPDTGRPAAAAVPPPPATDAVDATGTAALAGIAGGRPGERPEPPPGTQPSVFEQYGIEFQRPNEFIVGYPWSEEEIRNVGGLLDAGWDDRGTGEGRIFFPPEGLANDAKFAWHKLNSELSDRITAYLNYDGPWHKGEGYEILTGLRTFYRNTYLPTIDNIVATNPDIFSLPEEPEPEPEPSDPRGGVGIVDPVDPLTKPPDPTEPEEPEEPEEPGGSSGEFPWEQSPDDFGAFISDLLANTGELSPEEEEDIRRTGEEATTKVLSGMSAAGTGRSSEAAAARIHGEHEITRSVAGAKARVRQEGIQNTLQGAQLYLEARGQDIGAFFAQQGQNLAELQTNFDILLRYRDQDIQAALGISAQELQWAMFTGQMEFEQAVFAFQQFASFMEWDLQEQEIRANLEIARAAGASSWASAIGGFAGLVVNALPLIFGGGGGGGGAGGGVV